MRTKKKREAAIIASMLYWAEGCKKGFSIANTDPKLIKTFIDNMFIAFGLNLSDLKVSIRIYEDLNRAECLRFWSKVTGVELSLAETSVNVLKGAKEGKLQFGMCRIRIKKGNIIHKTIRKIIGKIAPIV